MKMKMKMVDENYCSVFEFSSLAGRLARAPVTQESGINPAIIHNCNHQPYSYRERRKRPFSCGRSSQINLDRMRPFCSFVRGKTSRCLFSCCVRGPPPRGGFVPNPPHNHTPHKNMLKNLEYYVSNFNSYYYFPHIIPFNPHHG